MSTIAKIILPNMSSVLQVIKMIQTELLAVGIETAMLDAELIVAKVLTLKDRGELLLHFEDYVPTYTVQQCMLLSRRRREHEPMSHILGEKEFWQHKFFVNREVLAPRPESELIVELAQKYFLPSNNTIFTEPLLILDLGVGSGCLIITLLHIYNNSIGVGVDISVNALKVAERNAMELGIPSSKIQLLNGNWFEPLSGLGKQYDLIVCNPPYVDKKSWINDIPLEVKQYEPELAVTDGQDGLAHYRAIAKQLMHFLKPGGVAIFEFGIGQSEAVYNIFVHNGLNIIETAYDLANIPRAVVVNLRNEKKLFT